MPTTAPPATGLTERERYFFDLQGFLLLRGALDEAEVGALNGVLDAIPPLEKGAWYGWVRGHGFGSSDGRNLQQIYEAGEPFEQLIDHPSWIEKVKECVGGKGTFDWNHGPLFIDENFANLRGPGEAIGVHSGGHERVQRTQFRCEQGKFHCGQINILMALTDIGPGDGATMVIPGSHKSNFRHPDAEANTIEKGGSVDAMEGAIEVRMQAGDVLLFVDAIAHGSARRTNPGERRICVYRYGPSWGFFRHRYRPSPGLLERLTPERRKIVWPHDAPLVPPGEEGRLDGRL